MKNHYTHQQVSVACMALAKHEQFNLLDFLKTTCGENEPGIPLFDLVEVTELITERLNILGFDEFSIPIRKGLIFKIKAEAPKEPEQKPLIDKERAEEIFLNALCNGAGEFAMYGFSLDYDAKDYKKACAKFKSERKAYSVEDVWMTILKSGGYLKFVDHEGGGLYTRKIFLKDVHDKVVLTPMVHLSNMLTGQDDAETADCIIQSVLFGELIFS